MVALLALQFPIISSIFQQIAKEFSTAAWETQKRSMDNMQCESYFIIQYGSTV